MIRLLDLALLADGTLMVINRGELYGAHLQLRRTRAWNNSLLPFTSAQKLFI